MKEPKDLGVRIISKEEKLWEEALNRTEEAIRRSKAEIEINEEILKLAKRKIESFKRN